MNKESFLKLPINSEFAFSANETGTVNEDGTVSFNNEGLEIYLLLNQADAADFLFDGNNNIPIATACYLGSTDGEGEIWGPWIAKNGFPEDKIQENLLKIGTRVALSNGANEIIGFGFVLHNQKDAELLSQVAILMEDSKEPWVCDRNKLGVTEYQPIKYLKSIWSGSNADGLHYVLVAKDGAFYIDKEAGTPPHFSDRQDIGIYKTVEDAEIAATLKAYQNDLITFKPEMPIVGYFTPESDCALVDQKLKM